MRRINLNAWLIIPVFLLMMLPAVGVADVICVDANAGGANDGSNREDAFATIQDGINAASHGDTVLVAAGTYYENIILKNGVKVRGAGADVTTINGWRTGSVVTAIGVGPDTILDGFTITNGSGTNNPIGQLSGGGIYLESGSPLITNNVVTKNSLEDPPGYRGGNGGGIYAYFSSATIAHNTIKDNSAEDGGGIYVDNWPSHSGPMPNIEYNNIYGNSAFSGGGIYLQISSPKVRGNTIAANTADAGGGIMGNHSFSLIANNIIVYNSAGRYGGGGIMVGNNASPVIVNNTVVGNNASGNGAGIAADIYQPPLKITNCIVWGNGDDLYNCTATYSDIVGGYPGEGNINADPHFVNPYNHDYHLLPTSPCIDAGDNRAVPSGAMTDFDGNPRIKYGIVDMGAFEYDKGPVTIYVEANASGANDGSSWADAFNDLQDALAAVWSGDEIRVAQGIYKPFDYIPHSLSPPMGDSNDRENVETTDIREATFQLINGVVIKGGYAGFCEPDPNARDIETYETILSGDLAGDDIDIVNPEDLLGEPSRAENSYCVVTGSGTDAKAVLDGFTIKGGNGGVTESRRGGGMYNYNGSPTLMNCTFSGNSTTIGGGMYNFASSPTVTNCTFCGNSANFGGGMYNEQGFVTLTNCIFIHNMAGEFGGGMANLISSPTVTNCTFSGNSAVHYGGGMCNYNNSPALTNCILWGNTAPGGSQIHNYDGTSSATVSYSDVQGGWPGQSNIDADPLFVEFGYWDANGTPDDVDDDFWVYGDYHLLPGSPCIDAGDPDYIAEPNETDLDGNPRVIGNRIDMGVYEYFNTRPVAGAGPDQTVEAQAPWGAAVTLDGSGSSDADSTPGTNDDINDFIWYLLDPCDPNADVLLGSGRIVDCNLPIGEHIILLEVIDKAGAFDTNEVTIIVQDTTPPQFTNIPQDLAVECDGSHNLNQLNAWLASATAVDVCGDVNITNDFAGLLNGCGATGSATVTWTAEDESGNTTTTPPATFTIVDTTPTVITCPPDATLECPADTSVEANGSATAGDACGSVAIAHSDQWQPGCDNTGTLTRTWTATDDCGNSSSCMQVIKVVDTTPPDFELSVSPTMLWPPDHKMVQITPSWTVSDDCVPSPDVSLVGIVANEGDNTIGDGHTTNDIQIGEDGSIYLRSERSGTGNDRVYTITYQAVDDCGNTTVRSATVSIPHDFKVLARIAYRWLWAGPAGRIPEDLNGDGFVNLADVARFAENWTR